MRWAVTCGRWYVFCVVDDRRWAGGGRFRGLRAHGGYWRGCGRRAWGLLELLEHATEWASSWDPAPTPAPSAQLLAAQLQLEPLWPAGWVFKLKSSKLSSFHPLASQLVPFWPNSAPSYSNVISYISHFLYLILCPVVEKINSLSTKYLEAERSLWMHILIPVVIIIGLYLYTSKSFYLYWEYKRDIKWIYEATAMMIFIEFSSNSSNI